MYDCDRLDEQMEILENVMRFVAQELRQMPHIERKGKDRVQSLLDDLYEVLDRHGYKGIVKLVGDVDPEDSAVESMGWAHDPHQGDYYLFKM